MLLEGTIKEIKDVHTHTHITLKYQLSLKIKSQSESQITFVSKWYPGVVAQWYKTCNIIPKMGFVSSHSYWHKKREKNPNTLNVLFKWKLK
jgi:hypothetical protein